MAYHCCKRTKCPERLAMLLKYCSGNLLDVGCAEGFFSRGVAHRCDAVFAIDNVKSNISAARDGPLEQEVKAKPATAAITFAHMGVEEWIVQSGAVMDTILYMAVHHHLIEQIGMPKARSVLRELMALTEGNLIFEMGQKNENDVKHFGWWKALPPGDPDDFIADELTAAGARCVEKIGTTPVHGVHRGLWRASA